MKRNTLDKLNRRRFLRGAGGTAIALPLLRGTTGVSLAQDAAPDRFVGLFVAQGIHASITQDFLDFNDMGVSVLRSLKPFEEKLTMVRGINVMARSRQAKTPHTHGCTSFLCAADTASRTTKGSTTMDWMFTDEMKNDTLLRTVNTGVWGGDDADERMRMVHSWRDVGQPNEPEPSTLRFFERVFGETPAAQGPALPADNARALKLAGYRRSILDVVREDYEAVVSPRSGFGPAVRQLINNHLETVRDLEVRAIALEEGLQNGAAPGCNVPGAPGELPGNNRRDQSKWQPIWDVMSDMFVQAYRCDLVRSGTYMVDSGGDKWSWTSPNFGSTSNIHGNTLHGWKQQSNRGLSLEIWQWYWDKVGDFFSRFDSPDYVDVDGGTLLDNTTLLVGTELADPDHDLNGFTYLIGGSKKRFKQGMHTFNGRSDADFYNTVLTGLGIEKRIGTVQGGSIKNYDGDLSFIA